MRFPAEEDDPLLLADRALDGHQHPGLARFDELEAAAPYWFVSIIFWIVAFALLPGSIP